MLQTANPSLLPVPRDDFADAAKGFAIILVVLGHCVQAAFPEPDKVWLYRLIYSFHMPLFFYLSGYVGRITLHRRPAGQTLARRATTLLVPYAAWFLIGRWWARGIGEGGISMGSLTEMVTKIDSGLWFLPVLFLCYLLIYPVVYFWQRFGDRPVLAFGITLGLLALLAILPEVNVAVKLIKYHFIFFAVPFLALEGKPGFARFFPVCNAVAPVIFLLLLRDWTRSYADYTLIRLSAVFVMHRYLVAATGIYVVLMCVHKIPRNHFWRSLKGAGTRTMDIYTVHLWILTLIPLTGLTGLGVADLAWLVVQSAVVMGGALAVSEWLIRPSPWLAGPLLGRNGEASR